jgi:Ca-activated chloride channel family protein
VRILIAAMAALALAPTAAHAQATDTRNRALIVLDASKSMNEDAGNGRTRLDAAKQAVDELVDKLPAGAPIGLRVYGSKVAETSREQACRDTELTLPIAPLDKDQMRSTVNGLTGKGRTPIGTSLLATPDDFGSGGGGRRTVILVSDGGDNCAPPDPCEAAEQVSKRGIDLSISVVGLQVNERVRRQLECIARAGGGSYTDVDDTDNLADELQALLTRAYRSYEPQGTKVQGDTEQRGDGPVLGAGQFQDSVHADEERWYSFDVPEGRRLIVTVTLIPPYDSLGYSGYSLELFDPEGTSVQILGGHVQGGLTAGEGGWVSTHTLRTAGPVAGGRYRVGAVVDYDDWTPENVAIPMEIAVQFLRPNEALSLALQPGQVATPTPTATPTARPQATAAPPPEASDGVNWIVVGGLLVAGVLAGLAAAAVLGRRVTA